MTYDQLLLKINAPFHYLYDVVTFKYIFAI